MVALRTGRAGRRASTPISAPKPYRARCRLLSGCRPWAARRPGRPHRAYEVYWSFIWSFCGILGCMVASPADGLARLRAAAESGELDTFCAKYHVRILTVFGSTARGEPTARDLDIGIMTEPGADFDIFTAVYDLMVLADFDDVDVAHLNRGGPLIRERALVCSILLYERSPGFFAAAQMGAVGERMETDRFRRQNLELLAG
jgi:predicted nucleotidyltransferase